MQEKIDIIDCGIGNLASVSNAFKLLGAEATITSTPKGIEQADKIVLPGVGAFGYFMSQLREKNLENPLKNAIREQKPYLGICLGMQALFAKSEESPGIAGLGMIEGKVVRFTQGKVPQVGWNTVTPLTNGIVEEGCAYFVNSYYCKPENEEYISAQSDYFGKFACAIEKENVFAVQFHPERSG